MKRIHNDNINMFSTYGDGWSLHTFIMINHEQGYKIKESWIWDWMFT